MYRAHREVGFFIPQSLLSAVSPFGVAANECIRVDLEEEVVRNAVAIRGATGLNDKR